MTESRSIRDVERLVHAELHRAMAQQGGAPHALAGHELLTAGLGLTSLQVAEVAARLAAAVGADPFARSMALTEMRTVGDVCRAVAAVAGPVTEIGDGGELAAVRRRAAARRARPAR